SFNISSFEQRRHIIEGLGQSPQFIGTVGQARTGVHLAQAESLGGRHQPTNGLMRTKFPKTHARDRASKAAIPRIARFPSIFKFAWWIIGSLGRPTAIYK